MTVKNNKVSVDGRISSMTSFSYEGVDEFGQLVRGGFEYSPTAFGEKLAIEIDSTALFNLENESPQFFEALAYSFTLDIAELALESSKVGSLIITGLTEKDVVIDDLKLFVNTIFAG